MEQEITEFSEFRKSDLSPVVDPGFFLGRCANSHNCYYFCQKLHENERIDTARGSVCPWHPHLDLPLNLLKHELGSI